MHDLSAANRSEHLEQTTSIARPDKQLTTTFIELEALAFALGKPELSASIKQEFADFQVDEDLGFDFTGHGEHLCVRVRKQDLSTPDVARMLQTATGVPSSAIGYAGMKDRRGHCSQWFSVQLREDQEGQLHRIENENLTIIESTRNTRKLKIGSHRSNHFDLVLRNCVGPAQEFDRRLQQMQAIGVPNYFGQQRFGREMSNLGQVTALFEQVLSAADTGGSRARHQRVKRGMLYSAARAYLFNQVLSQRIELGNWASYVPGDVPNLAGTSRFFAVAPGQWDDTLQRRLQEFDIHLTGPLPGVTDSKDKYISYGEAADIEGAVLEQFPTLIAGLQGCGVMAARRPMRFVPADLDWAWESDSVLRLRFALSKGCYATSLLRELCNIHSHTGSTLIHAE